MRRPETFQPIAGGGGAFGQVDHFFLCFGIERLFILAGLSGAFTQEALGGAGVPFIPVLQEPDEFQIGFRAEIHFHRLIGSGPFQAIDPAVAPIPAFCVRVMAMLLIVPVNDVNGAVRAGLQINGYILRVAAEELVFPRVHRVKP